MRTTAHSLTHVLGVVIWFERGPPRALEQRQHWGRDSRGDRVPFAGIDMTLDLSAWVVTEVAVQRRLEGNVSLHLQRHEVAVLAVVALSSPREAHIPTGSTGGSGMSTSNARRSAAKGESEKRLGTSCQLRLEIMMPVPSSRFRHPPHRNATHLPRQAGRSRSFSERVSDITELALIQRGDLSPLSRQSSDQVSTRPQRDHRPPSDRAPA